MKDFLNLVFFVSYLILFAYIFTHIKNKINVKISALKEKIDESIIDLFYKKAITRCSNMNEIIDQQHAFLQKVQKEKYNLRRIYWFYSYIKLFLDPLFFVLGLYLFYISFFSP